jgi:glycosyltransferase involved in cell wall biosynthesis
MAGGTRHYDLGKQLVERGLKVTIFASGFDHSTKKYVKMAPTERFRIEDHDGVRFVWLNTIPYYRNDIRRVLNMFSYGIRVLNTIKGFDKPDVVIGSSMHPVAALAGWWLARKYGARFVFEVRDLWPQTAVDMGAMKPTSVLVRLLYAWEKFMYQRAEKIISLLPKAKEYIISRGIDPDKIVWIPNGVNLDRFDNPEPLDPKSEAAKVFTQHKNKFKVVYTGAHGPANGLDVILRAAHLLSEMSADVHIFLVGDGPEKSNLIKKAQQYYLSNITFLDPVPKAQVPSLLNQADLLLHCLKPLEVFKHGISPNKMFDYLASRRPIIMAVEAANNIVEDAKAGITVEPGNPQALAEGILKIKQMTAAERGLLGANGRAYVEKYHNIKVLGEIFMRALFNAETIQG